MKALLKVFSIVALSIVLSVGIFLTNSVSACELAAVTPKGAADIIRESDSVQEAGNRLKAADSSDVVAGQIRDRNTTQDQQRAKRDDLIGTTQEKLKGAAETVKEKLNLDEPLAPSTKEFLGKRQEDIQPNGDVIVREQPGYYQKNRQARQFVEQDSAQNYQQEIHQ